MWDFRCQVDSWAHLKGQRLLFSHAFNIFVLGLKHSDSQNPPSVRMFCSLFLRSTELEKKHQIYICQCFNAILHLFSLSTMYLFQIRAATTRTLHLQTWSVLV